MSNFTFGYASIKAGAPETDGGMGQTLTSVGKVLQDSATLTTDDPTFTEFFSEGNDTPEISIPAAGKTVLKYTIMDPTPQTKQRFMGGTVTGDGTGPTPYVWNKPATQPVIELSHEVTPATGDIWSFPRCAIIGKINWPIGSKGLQTLEVTATVLQPTKAGEPAASAEAPVAA